MNDQLEEIRRVSLSERGEIGYARNEDYSINGVLFHLIGQ